MKDTLELTIKSCGIGAKNNTIVRAFDASGTRWDIPTDTNTFAKLAEAGMRVHNEPSVKHK